MPWVRLDDDMPYHRKFIGLSERAFVMWISALCFSGRQLTDGKISRASLPYVRPGLTEKDLDAIARELVDRGLWDSDGKEGWVIHDYLDYQPARESVHAERNAKRERMRRLRAERAGARAGEQTAAQAGAPPKNVRSTSGRRSSAPSPPVPSQENPDGFSTSRDERGRVPEVVELYVKERRALGSEPVESDKKRVGAQAKELLSAGKPLELVHAAAREAARRNQPGLIVRVAGDLEAGTNDARKPPRALAQAGGRFDDREYM